MINFTGQTRKRVVNLGNRGARNGSFLEHSKSQRVEREIARGQERAIRVIQSYVKRYLFMRVIRDEFFVEWLDSTELSPRWISQALFITKWSNASFERSKTMISHIYRVLIVQSLDTVASLPLYSRQKMVHVLETILFRITVRSKDDDECLQRIIQCLIALNSPNIKYHQTIERLTLIFSRDIEISSNTSNSAFELANSITSGNIPLVLLKHILEKNVELFYGGKFRALQKVLLLTTTQSFEPFSASEIVDFLVCYLQIHKHLGIEYSIEDMKCISVLSREIGCYLRENTELYPKFEEIEEIEEIDEKDYLTVSMAQYEILLDLYSRNFVNQLFKFLDVHEEDCLFDIVGTLPYLIPSLNSSFYMFATVSGGIYLWIYNRISKDPLFNEILEKETNGSYIVNGFEFYDTNQKQKNFWNLVYSLESLYSYWLIVSHDSESFLSHALTIDQLSVFMKFLKNLCLFLIFSNTDSKHNKIKDASISLLDQLYTRNSRFPFIKSNDMWEVPNVSFEVSTLKAIMVSLGEAKENSEVEEQNFNFNKELAKIHAPLPTLAKFELLHRLPFFIPFKIRVSILQSLIDNDKPTWQTVYFDNQKVKVHVHRDNILHDAFRELHSVGDRLKHPLSITFFNDYGEEAGIDGGGLTKEFLSSVITEGFNPKNEDHLFQETSGYQLFPSLDLYFKLKYHQGKPESNNMLLNLYRFLGSIIGKCFFENVLIDITFAPFFLSKWSQVSRGNNSLKSSIDDLKTLDEDLYKNLMKLTLMDSEEIENLDINFSLDEVVDGKSYTVELIPNGSKTKVTISNRLNYIHQIADFKLNRLLHLQTKYFMTGLFEIISSSWLAMFYPSEIQMLILGAESDVNIQDWEANVVYGYYDENDTTIKMFWEVVREMSSQERFKLLKFVTLVLRAPLLGFGSLNPKFGIQRTDSDDNNRLPTASTCANLLKLPAYDNKTTLREKLIYSINTDAGFDLS